MQPIKINLAALTAFLATTNVVFGGDCKILCNDISAFPRERCDSINLSGSDVFAKFGQSEGVILNYLQYHATGPGREKFFTGVGQGSNNNVKMSVSNSSSATYLIQLQDNFQHSVFLWLNNIDSTCEGPFPDNSERYTPIRVLKAVSRT